MRESDRNNLRLRYVTSIFNQGDVRPARRPRLQEQGAEMSFAMNLNDSSLLA